MYSLEIFLLVSAILTAVAFLVSAFLNEKILELIDKHKHKKLKKKFKVLDDQEMDEVWFRM
jgi:hypothetical protein